MNSPLRYEDRGASADKSDVHAAIQGEVPGILPGAFCKILPDFLTGSSEHCLIIHADGAGTKAVAAYLGWKETGDASVFRGLAQDSLVMNLDDMLCSGATGPFLLSNTIGRNAKLITGEVLAEIIAGYRDCVSMLAQHGVEIHSGGGETADLGDAMRTLVVDSTLVTRMKRNLVVSGERLRPGLALVGLASFGQATYESQENSGIGSNGLTSMRHEFLSPYYREHFPEAFAPEIADFAYTGSFRLQDQLPGSTSTVGEALLSPTRTYAPILMKIFAELREEIAFIFHITGGGQTKPLRFGKGLTYIKDHLFSPPPLFRYLQEHSRLNARELYRSLNMGHRLEIACEPSAVPRIIAISEAMGVAAQGIGRIESGPAHNRVIIKTARETFEYQLEKNP